MNNDEIVIKAKNLTKVYKTLFSKQHILAVDKLNLEIYRGEIFGILGPNGSGKTTTMKIFMGLLKPTAGYALVFGKSPFDITVKDRIGFLPEETYLYRFLNAIETLDFYGKIFRIPRKERKRRIEELLQIVQLQKEAWKRPIKEYSKGMTRKIGLAQALINNPDLIFLDEPTSGLDPIISRQVKDLIISLKEKGKTVFLSSHLLADVEDVCTRIGILHNGELKKSGTVEELLVQKNVVQVKISSLHGPSFSDIHKLLEGKNLKVIKIEHPVDSLETLFLDTIKYEKYTHNN